MGTIITIIFAAALIEIFLKPKKKRKRKKSYNNSKPYIEKNTNTYKKTTYQEKQKKGKDFEEYVAKYYSNLNYMVIEHGKSYGKKDQGIDLIATEKEVILIQCKNYSKNHSWKIRQKDIKAFRINCIDFVEKNKQYKTKNTKILFIVSKDVLDIGAKLYIEEKKKEGKKIDYKIIEYS